jgi:hypothetical protein
MPQTLPNGTVVPINSDAYNLTADLATMGNSSNVVYPVANQAARDALTPTAGMVVLRLDTGAIEAYLTGAWVPVTQVQGASPYMFHAGTVNVTVPVGNGAGTASVTFPTAFTQAPIITVNINAVTGSNSYKLMAHAYGQTTTGFTMDLRTIDGTGVAATYTMTVHWIAIQMTPASAAG